MITVEGDVVDVAREIRAIAMRPVPYFNEAPPVYLSDRQKQLGKLCIVIMYPVLCFVNGIQTLSQCTFQLYRVYTESFAKYTTSRSSVRALSFLSSFSPFLV